jgi:hypothetical protein
MPSDLNAWTSPVLKAFAGFASVPAVPPADAADRFPFVPQFGPLVTGWRSHSEISEVRGKVVDAEAKTAPVSVATRRAVTSI